MVMEILAVLEEALECVFPPAALVLVDKVIMEVAVTLTVAVVVAVGVQVVVTLLEKVAEIGRVVMAVVVQTLALQVLR
jgi:uncharacterized metal-binding protein